MVKKIFKIITVVFILPLAFSQNNVYGQMNDGWKMMNYGYGGLFMWLLFILGIILLIYIVAQLPKGKEQKMHETPLEILKKRYARGEINKEEFERIKQEVKD
jgi:putative membrane protein